MIALSAVFSSSACGQMAIWYRFILTFRVLTRLGKKVCYAFGRSRFTQNSLSNARASAKRLRGVCSIPTVGYNRGKTAVLVLILFLNQSPENLATRALKNVAFGDQDFVTFTFTSL